MFGYQSENSENVLKKAFEQRNKEKWIRINPRLVLISLRTSGPWLQSTIMITLDVSLKISNI